MPRVYLAPSLYLFVVPSARLVKQWINFSLDVLGQVTPTKATANKAFEGFLQTYETKYPKAVDCLRKDREALLAFCQFSAEHWQHIRTTNPIESTFATVRLRTAKPRGCLSRATALTMAFQLARCAEKTWRRLRGYHRLTEMMEGIEFVDGDTDTRKVA